MLITLLNIVLPVLLVAALGYGFGRWSGRTAEMGFINHANVMVFCPALIFSALLHSPVDLLQGWPLIVAGVLIFVLPGVFLWLLPSPGGLPRAAVIVPGMFRNTGNLGIPLMMLAYGKEHMGAIVLLFVISNTLFFSLGLALLSHGGRRWEWMINPNFLAAVLGIVLAPWVQHLPRFLVTAVDMTGDIAIPLMLFGLGVRLSQDRITRLALAFRINVLYLLVSLATLPVVLWLLPLTPDWKRLVVLSLMLPPAVLNYLMTEQYDVQPETVANVVLLGNLMSVLVIPAVVWATLVWI
ncbi:MAG: AEC family transporter [Ottowia sp.]|nr:AEC family transporter [Ottowia sp.]